MVYICCCFGVLFQPSTMINTFVKAQASIDQAVENADIELSESDGNIDVTTRRVRKRHVLPVKTKDSSVKASTFSTFQQPPEASSARNFPSQPTTDTVELDRSSNHNFQLPVGFVTNIFDPECADFYSAEDIGVRGEQLQLQDIANLNTCAVRNKSSDIDPSEAAVEQYVRKWLAGSGDRNGGRARRAKQTSQLN
ncbi:unnamed protein product [Allacma fusca]|uniref:Uncharacterized protein n=1 Tax=Allacma fusca TaxID=39272 RepID=A0A8J2J593_9HEXA|nr:unnamed protein product [Allacma fusca]